MRKSVLSKMDPFEMRAVLESMVVLTDTREQPTDRAKRRYESFGVPYKRVKLDYGDYTWNAKLPSGRWIHDEDSQIYPLITIERKMDLTELSGCLTHDRQRFRSEMERAALHGAKTVLLVEGATWENLLNGKYRTKFNPEAFSGSLIAWMLRYDVIPVFCKEETTGQLIRRILYRDLKERLERGDFDVD